MSPLPRATKVHLLFFPFALLIGVALLLVACGGGKKTPTEAPFQAPPANADVNVAVSILPQKYFLERIGGEHVAVLVMVEPGHDPVSYEPKPGQLQALKERSAYFSIGVPFESAWLDDIAAANPAMTMVDTAQGIELMDGDPHIWLSPTLVETQAQTIYEALAQLDPAHQADYQANLDAFLGELAALDDYIAANLQGVAGKKFIVNHPAWGYFARDYGLEMIPLAVDDQTPDAARLDELAAFAKEEGIDIVFVQREFGDAIGTELALKIGGRPVPISPLNPNWESNLRSVSLMFANMLSRQE